MKWVSRISFIVLVIGVLALALHCFILPLADWIVRTNGIIMVLSLFAFVYSTLRLQNNSD